MAWFDDLSHTYGRQTPTKEDYSNFQEAIFQYRMENQLAQQTTSPCGAPPQPVRNVTDLSYELTCRLRSIRVMLERTLYDIRGGVISEDAVDSVPARVTLVESAGQGLMVASEIDNLVCELGEYFNQEAPF
jgi:hypothetical protein